MIKTNGFNQIASQDDRRLHNRMLVNIRAQVFDATAKAGSDINVKVECSVTRTEKKAGNQFFGCKVIGENKDYQLYCFMLQLYDKNKNKLIVEESDL